MMVVVFKAVNVHPWAANVV